MKCAACGDGRVRQLARAGRTFRFRTLSAVEVPAELEIPTCDNCGEVWLDPASSEALDAALEASFHTVARKRVVRALDEITSVISQRKLEEQVGLSQGYLSKLRAGAREASPELVCLLGLLAIEPGARLSELRTFWEKGELHAKQPVAPKVELFGRSNSESKLDKNTLPGEGPTVH